MKASRGFRKSRLAHRRIHRRHERLETRLLLDAAAAEYGQLPLSFEINQGQTAPQVNFLAHGSGYGLFLTPSEAVLSLKSAASPAGNSPGTATAAATTSGDVLRMQFVGANPDAQATGLDKLAGVTNYLIGNDPSQWHTGVANYGQVEYQNLYAGVSLTYYGNQRQLEYDFTVAAGADPSQIGFHIAGAESVSLDAHGNLVLHTSGGDVFEHAPVIYQQTPAGRQAIDGHYTLSGDGRVGFSIGNYDRSQTLVIDPILSYSTYLGGSGLDQANAIAVDAQGEAFVAGGTSSTNFPTALGALQSSSSGNGDAFVAKLNAAGSGLVYSTYLGGSNGDEASAIAVDAAGDAYVTGETSSANFPTTPGALQTSLAGFGNTFVTKLNAAGSGLVYSTYLGGSDFDQGTGIAVDAEGHAYVTGYTNSTNFPTTPGAPQTFNAGGMYDAFVYKLDAAGRSLVYSTYLGGGKQDTANGIAIDSAGDAYVAGETFSSDFPTTPGAFQTSMTGIENAFVTELNAGGTKLLYSTYLGGNGFDYGAAIAVDAAGQAYVAGSTTSTTFPTTAGALQTSIRGGQNAFVAKLNAAGSGLVYSTYLGGSSDDVANAIAIDAADEAYVAGGSSSTDFPVTPGAPQTYNAGGDDAILAKLNVAGNALVYSTYLGGSMLDNASAIAVDPAGEAYVAGFTSSTNFPTTPGALQNANAGGEDGFVFKLATTALSLTAVQVAATEGAPFTGTLGFLIDEAQAFDPASNFTALVAWGDGTTSTATLAPYKNGFNLLATHTYAEDGAYQLIVTVVDADGDSATAAGTATVADAPLSGASRAVAFTEDAALLRSVASFEDDDPKGAVGDYTANINWGDGQSSPGTVVPDGALFDVTGTHQYVADGNFPITVTVNDAGGAATVIDSTATVADSLAAKPVNLTVFGSKNFNGAVATFTDPDNSLGPADYTAKITWDDGTTTNGVITAVGSGPAATFSVAGTHLFTSFSGFHSVSVAISDVDDGSVTTVVDSVLDPPGLTANQIYVLSAYQSAFGTAGTTDTVVDGNTLAAWAAKLDAGASTASFATALLGSSEYYGMLVGGLYEQYLGRAADAAGLAYWVAQMQQGETDAQIEAAFAGSSEFYQHAGGTDAGWVNAMYQAVLGRAADAGGLAYWTGQLAQGASRAAVAQGFAGSTEREAQLINDDYFTDLGRAADPAGQAYWVNGFENGLRNEDIIAGFLASEEYYQSHSS
jgi:hypothetical protein